jgi:hypothetical protein
VSDIVITKIIEPDQTVVVLAGEGYVAIEVYYEDLRAEKSTVPDAFLLLSLAGAERLRYSLGSAVIMARQILSAATSAGGE